MTVRQRASRRRLRVMMLGLRGVPRIQGGVERHVEELARRLAEHGCAVEIVARRPYVDRKSPHRWRGLIVTPLPAPRRRSLEAIVHTFLGIVHAARRRPDILHVHAIGPSLLVLVARALRLRVVVTHHGFDYDRAKWGALARATLKAGEWAGMRFADRRIAVSQGIAAAMSERYGVRVEAIPNGVSTAQPPSSAGALRRFGLEPGRYAVMVSRLVPEKRHLDLIRAFRQVSLPDWKLAIVGAADHADDYSRFVLRTAEATPGVVATGFQSGLALRELLGHAGLFVLPSSHEGLPISLLEALSYGLPVLASDIAPNREIGLPEACYFPVGDVEALGEGLRGAWSRASTETERAERRDLVRRHYDWDAIAERTRLLYRTLSDDPRLPTGNTGVPRLADPLT